MKNKKIMSLLTIFMVTMSSFCIMACSGDDDDNHKYPFVGKAYVYQWTLQNTTSDYRYVLYFSSDSTFTFTPIKVETGESTRQAKEGMYEVESDGRINFSGVVSCKTNIKGQKITLYQGKFKSTEYKQLSVYRFLEFNTGNKRTDWIDFNLD